MKTIILMLFVVVATTVKAHIPDSLAILITDHIFQDGYIEFYFPEGNHPPYVYSDDVGMLNSDTVFWVKEPGTYKVFIESYYNSTVQYQMNVVIEKRPALIKDSNGKGYVFDAKILKYVGLKAKKLNCE